MLADLPLACAAAIDPVLMRQIVRVESAGNPYAIGVVGGRLARQPRSLAEALATAQSLERQGFNYSIGLSQVNRVHFARLGWSQAMASGFDACRNLQAGAEILRNCHARALGAGYDGAALDGSNAASRASLSCYYSGSFTSGERLGYVSRVLGAGSAPRQPYAAPSGSTMFD